MKTSHYNTVLDLGDNVSLMFNALSGRFLALNGVSVSSHSDLVTEIKDEKMLSGLKQIGAVIDDSVDEVSLVRDLIEKNDYDDSVFHLHINPTLDCNFKCWYCYENHKSGSLMSSSTKDSVVRLVENIVSDYPGLKRFNLSFFGGEPLIGFHKIARPLIVSIREICQRKQIDMHIHFTSNGYLLNDAMLEFFNEYKSSFQITLDGHRPFHDKVRKKADGSGSYDVILKNIKALADRENQVLVRVNYTKENIGSIKDIADDLAVIPEHVRTFISVDLQQVWQDADSSAGEDLRKMVLDFCRDIDKSGIRCTSHYIRDLVRNSCYGDKRNYVLVNYDGYVYRCTARDFNEDNRAGVLHADGCIEYYDNALEKRLAAKFSKTVCHTCRIAPLCAGGCCQQAVEHTDDECIYGYTSDDIDAIVADRFEYLFLK